MTTIPRALATGHFKVVTRAHVTTIEVDGDGRATGVTYVTDGVESLCATALGTIRAVQDPTGGQDT